MNNNILEAQIEADKKRDSQSYDRYPVRFVFLNIEDFQSTETIQFLKNKNVVFLSDLALKNNDHDGWITRTEFINAIKNAAKNFESQDTIIIGFSEFARFLKAPEFESTILTLFDIENKTSNELYRKRRIYILCFSLKEQITAVLEKKYKRFELLDPIINKEFSFSTSEINNLYFANRELAGLFKSNANIIKESQEWLGLCRNVANFDSSKPIICVSNVLYEWYNYAYPDNAFQIDIIKDYADFISKIYGIALAFRCVEKDSPFWEELTHILSENKRVINVDELTTLILKTSNLDTKNLLYCWMNAEIDFIKWYVKNYIIYYRSNSFIGKMMKICNGNTNDSLFEAFWNIPKHELTQEDLNERKRLCSDFSRYSSFYSPDDRIIETVRADINKMCSFEIGSNGYAIVDMMQFETQKYRIRDYFDNEFIPYITGFSNAEKIILIYLVSLNLYSPAEIEEYYPDFFEYLVSEETISEDWDSYFTNYRLSKIRGKDTEELASHISKLNANEISFYDWYNSIPTQSQLLKDYQSLESHSVYIIDGLGAEYLPLICYLIDNTQGYRVNAKKYAVSHLPTVTDINKHYIKNYKKWITDFDSNVIHGEFYRFARNINKALNTLSSIIADIINKEGGNSFIITSDHGATARAKWTLPNKKYSFNNADHEGRCCLINQEMESNNEYLVFQDNGGLDKKYLVSLRDVSLNNNPKYEDHGGATPEEVMVPFVVASSFDDDFKTFVVTPIDLNVTGLDKIIRFSVTPNTDSVIVIEEDGTKTAAVYDNGNWMVELNSGKQQRILICVANKKCQFDVVSSAKSFIEEDDGFDD